MTTPVIFRAFRNDQDVIALFPAMAGDHRPDTCGSYMHIGQHGAASVRLFYEDTRPATPDEYMPLMRELERQGYDDLRVYQRYQPHFTAARLRELSRDRN